ncbi:hypothetical protein [Corynebacterium durum]|uniref:hypothetical protein n=1 Tax=Corynebacterium durum TaxID=61592 RepID=UPI0028E19D35|nr:hypothetical protein [Corynebacterium durum]
MTPRGLADQRAPDISNTPPPANSKASQSRIDLLPHAATTIGPIKDHVHTHGHATKYASDKPNTSRKLPACRPHNNKEHHACSSDAKPRNNRWREAFT